MLIFSRFEVRTQVKSTILACSNYFSQRIS